MMTTAFSSLTTSVLLLAAVVWNLQRQLSADYWAATIGVLNFEVGVGAGLALAVLHLPTDYAACSVECGATAA